MESVLFIFAHPDDVAYGMGGVACLLKEKYKLHLVCATRGERGVKGLDLAATGAIREKEEEKERELLGAKLTFLDRVDRELFADADVCGRVAEIVTTEKPAAVLTIWPVDSHPDHSAVSEVARKALFISQHPAELIYCEEGEGQSMLFHPAIYVDISRVIQNKMELIRCHTCQNRSDSLAQAALKKAARRGSESGCAYAEAYQSILPYGPDRRSILSALSA